MVKFCISLLASIILFINTIIFSSSNSISKSFSVDKDIEYLKFKQRCIERAKKLYLNPRYIEVVKLAYPTLDSKSIVDRPTVKPLKEVLNALEKIDIRNKNDAIDFVQEYLGEPGIDVKVTNLTDWKEYPSFMNRLKLNETKDFAYEINKIWQGLYRSVRKELDLKGHVTSLIPLKHPFVVPGGRFSEMFYWDTYWIIEGLLVCEMPKTVKLMIENFIYLIHEYGFIPNGSRVYYLDRSQPPIFSEIVYSYFNYIKNSKDISIQEKNESIDYVLNVALPYMVKEYEFWMVNRSIKIQTKNSSFILNYYYVNTTEPRPESFYEDIETAKNMDFENKKRIFRDKASAAESGFDFSSRWFKDPFKIETIETTNIIPVDLNSILFKTENIISELYKYNGNKNESNYYLRNALMRQTAMNELMWSSEDYFWADYNIRNNSKNTQNFYLSNLLPLWAEIKPKYVNENQIIEKNKPLLTLCQNGVPFSFLNSKEQWDYPNVWAPQQHFLIMTLLKYDRALALKLAQNFFTTVYYGWVKTGYIFEKYDALVTGERGKGGEYVIQTGFGWTNGVILSLLDIFEDGVLKYQTKNESNSISIKN